MTCPMSCIVSQGLMQSVIPSEGLLTHGKCLKTRSNASISRSSVTRNQPSICSGHVICSEGYSTEVDQFQ